MPERTPDRLPESTSQRTPFSKQVSEKEARKIRASQNKDRTLRMGLGAFGAVGWSIAVPTLIGVVVGIWVDRRWPSPFSWTLALLLTGLTLGCMSAWIWISKERKAIDEERDNHT